MLHGKAYSEDLRLKVLSALDGVQTKMAIHKNFDTARSTLNDWIAFKTRIALNSNPYPGFHDKVDAAFCSL